MLSSVLDQRHMYACTTHPFLETSRHRNTFQVLKMVITLKVWDIQIAQNVKPIIVLKSFCSLRINNVNTIVIGKYKDLIYTTRNCNHCLHFMEIISNISL